MERFIRWLTAVGKAIGDKDIKVRIDDKKISINEHVYLFENEFEKRFAKILFEEKKESKKRSKKVKKDES